MDNQLVIDILRKYSLQGESRVNETPLMKKIIERMQNQEELVFVLPAFPAKSPSEDKTSGVLPDLGEVLALKNLQAFCDAMAAIHPEGATLIICSDGRAFGDVVQVSDDSIDSYSEGIKAIIKDYGLSSLTVFGMDDLYPGLSPGELRSLLLDVYAEELEEVKDKVRSAPEYRTLFNGIHRFLFEDQLSMNREVSKSRIQKETKEKAYELLRRSEAWSALLNAHFRDTLRLSIHPHKLGSEKFGIKLVPSSSKWATPWHNVTVKIQDQFQLMHKKEALGLNAILKMEKDKYAYFEVPAV